MRRVWPNGTIGTVAGTGVEGFSGDGGPAAQAELDLPKALAVLPDLKGFLVGDAQNNRVRLVTLDLRSPFVLRVVTRTLRTKAGRAVRLRYTLTQPASGPAARAPRRHDRGGRPRDGADRRRLDLVGRGLRRGRYKLRLTARAADGRSAKSTGTMTLTVTG